MWYTGAAMPPAFLGLQRGGGEGPQATEDTNVASAFLSQLQNQKELRAPTAEKAAFYLDAALAARSTSRAGCGEDARRSSHMLFTLHVYQYRVEKCGQGGSRCTGRPSAWGCHVHEVACPAPTPRESLWAVEASGCPDHSTCLQMCSQCLEVVAAFTSSTWAAATQPSAEEEEKPQGDPYVCLCQLWAVSSWP